MILPEGIRLMSGKGQLAEKIWKFIGSMPPPATEHERIASASLWLRERCWSQKRRLERTR
jgi:hypothetical protein